MYGQTHPDTNEFAMSNEKNKISKQPSSDPMTGKGHNFCKA